MTDFAAKLGLGVSTGAHVVGLTLGVFWLDLFEPEPEPEETTIEITLAPYAPEPAVEDAPPTAPPAEDLAAVEEPPVEPEPVEETPVEPDPVVEPEPELVVEDPPEPEPEPERIIAEAPFDVSPAAPAQPRVNPAALADQPVDDAIRAALPAPRAPEAPDAPDQPNTELDPDVDRASTPAPAVDQEPPPPPAFSQPPPELVESAPDPQPVADVPDTPPEPEAVAADDPPDPPVADDPPEEDAALETAPETAPRPRRRPQTQVAEPEPVPQTPAERTEEARAFDPNRLDDILGSATAATPQTPTQNFNPEIQRPASGPPLSRREREGLRLALDRCWRRPFIGGDDPSTLRVALEFRLGRDGRLDGEPQVVFPAGPTTSRQNAAIASAKDAVRRCEPFSQLPPEKYDQWRVIRATFDPADDRAVIQ